MAATEPKKKVLVTGAEGVIGTAVREFLADKYDLYALTLTPQDFPSHVGNIADFEQIRPAFDGMDAVVHLAASADIETPWNYVLNNNSIGTYNVFEAARQAGAKTVWLQLGIWNEDAAELAASHGMHAVMDRCVKIEHARLFGGLNWAGVNTGVISARRAA